MPNICLCHDLLIHIEKHIFTVFFIGMLTAARQNWTRLSFYGKSKMLFCGLLNEFKCISKYELVFDFLQKIGLMQLHWKSGVFRWHQWSRSSGAVCLRCSWRESSQRFWRAWAFWIEGLQLRWSCEQRDSILWVSRTSYRHMHFDALCRFLLCIIMIKSSCSSLYVSKCLYVLAV